MNAGYRGVIPTTETDAMNPQEFLAAAAARGIRVPAEPAAPSLDDMTSADFHDMIGDYVKLTASGRAFQRAHPLAMEAWADRRDVFILARNAGLTSADFSAAMGSAYSTLLMAGFSASTADIEAMTFPVDAQNYKSQKLSQVQLGTVPENFEDAEPGKIGFAIVEARDGHLREFSGRISFSRQAWSARGEFLARAIQTHARSVFPALERQAIALALESSTVPSIVAPLTVSGLNTAYQTMRLQTVAGLKSNLAPAVVIVPPALEITAKVLVGAVDPSRTGLRIAVNPWLTSATTYYLVCDPRECPALLRLRLRNTLAPSVYSAVGDSGQIMFGLSYAFDIVHSGGPGVLECTAS